MDPTSPDRSAASAAAVSTRSSRRSLPPTSASAASSTASLDPLPPASASTTAGQPAVPLTPLPLPRIKLKLSSFAPTAATPAAANPTASATAAATASSSTFSLSSASSSANSRRSTRLSTSASSSTTSIHSHPPATTTTTRSSRSPASSSSSSRRRDHPGSPPPADLDDQEYPLSPAPLDPTPDGNGDNGAYQEDPIDAADQPTSPKRRKTSSTRASSRKSAAAASQAISRSVTQSLLTSSSLPADHIEEAPPLTPLGPEHVHAPAPVTATTTRRSTRAAAAAAPVSYTELVTSSSPAPAPPPPTRSTRRTAAATAPVQTNTRSSRRANARLVVTHLQEDEEVDELEQDELADDPADVTVASPPPARARSTRRGAAAAPPPEPLVEDEMDIDEHQQYQDELDQDQDMDVDTAMPPPSVPANPAKGKGKSKASKSSASKSKSSRKSSSSKSSKKSSLAHKLHVSDLPTLQPDDDTMDMDIDPAMLEYTPDAAGDDDEGVRIEGVLEGEEDMDEDEFLQHLMQEQQAASKGGSSRRDRAARAGSEGPSAEYGADALDALIASRSKRPIAKFTDEERALKSAEQNRRRELLKQQRIEDAKDATISRLLKKQASKKTRSEQADERRAEQLALADRARALASIRYVESRRGGKLVALPKGMEVRELFPGMGRAEPVGRRRESELGVVDCEREGCGEKCKYRFKVPSSGSGKEDEGKVRVRRACSLACYKAVVQEEQEQQQARMDVC